MIPTMTPDVMRAVLAAHDERNDEKNEAFMYELSAAAAGFQAVGYSEAARAGQMFVEIFGFDSYNGEYTWNMLDAEEQRERMVDWLEDPKNQDLRVAKAALKAEEAELRSRLEVNQLKQDYLFAETPN